MEKVIYALYLLQQLKRTGLPFIFKGGTSLLLLLPQPARFSVDIDIIVPPDFSRTDLEHFLHSIKDENIFAGIVLDERRSYKGKIVKAHYKFLYTSQYSGKPQEVLLDILFEKNQYPTCIERPITCEWVRLTDDALFVTTPDVNCIAGDKLTAFAPGTAGIPYGADKEREIIKQLFDIGTLYEWITDIKTFRTSFTNIATIELQYRALPLTTDDVLTDILATALILARRENQPTKSDTEKYEALALGVKQFGYFVYNGNFRIDDAVVASAKAALLAASIRTNTMGVLPVYDAQTCGACLITHTDYTFLNKKLRNVRGGALFYWSEVIKLLHPQESGAGQTNGNT